MSPILSLPTELFVAIGVTRLFKSHSLEWILSHTSSRLRAAIIGAPTLWTRVEADLTDESSVEIAKLYLERSRAREIWANLYHDWNGGDSDALHALMAARFHHLYPPHQSYVAVEDRDEDNLDGVGERAVGCYGHYSCPEIAASRAPQLQLLLPCRCCTDRRFVQNGECEAPRTMRPLSLARLSVPRHAQRAPARPIHAPLPAHSVSEVPPHEAPYDIEDDEWFLLRIIDFFETPALSELMIESVHDDIYPLFNKTSLAHASFPALASLSLINREPCAVGCDNITAPPYTISAPPLALFPALSSLALVNHCYTANLVTDILGPDSGSWTLPQTITLCPRDATLEAVSDALRIRGQVLPKFRLSSALASLENWGEIGADVEIFDPTGLLDAFNLR
ncbi:hypothetical protein B0H14DRAFT_2728377 [Mycena olivaceomarginata]|nr:hypothetical protein B0H14DRAFT_2728377 [Mycena olivaceomarginata]